MVHLTAWRPDDRLFWQREGGRIALRNLALAVPALVLAFAVWALWSVAVVFLPRAGFAFSTPALFALAALPALSGAVLRAVHALVLPAAGGRKWTAASTALLLVPVLGFGFAAQEATTGYGTFAVLALLCGIGGGSFATSMAHVGACFPASERPFALGLNAGMGNLGISLAQFAVPIAVTTGFFGGAGGESLRNAGFLWAPLVVVAAAAAWLGMDDLDRPRDGRARRVSLLHRRHVGALCWLYLGAFGTYLGFALALPLLLDSQFASSHALAYVWIAPLAGALVRPVGGWLADEVGGASVAFATFLGMLFSTLGASLCLPGASATGSLGGFVGFAGFAVVLAGIGSGAVFRLVPAVLAAEQARRAALSGRPGADGAPVDAAETTAALGMASALGALGGFVIPMACAAALAATGSTTPAFALFTVFYASCALLTWRAFLRGDPAID